MGEECRKQRFSVKGLYYLGGMCTLREVPTTETAYIKIWGRRRDQRKMKEL